ncbi:hypothetical protein ALC57_13261 [Trachymyrmex cornetzi]|uniref:Uncharacterized protein n=1 Tax=Trachymyrmex cornetzi TaxID=471704 RepID=A0A151IZN6_9HYME|nr:hypothetical protein ALC57_13261 [Trachymyrmex cornetzi]
MSLTLTLTEKTSILTASYFPALDLSNGEYELGLTNFETAAIFHTFDTKGNNDDNNDDDDYVFNDYVGDNIHKDEILILRANENTMKSEIKYAYRVNFTKPNNIGSLLGYSQSRVIPPNKWYASDQPVNIMNITKIRIECNITSGAYNNDKHIQYMNVKVPPGYKLSDTPTHVIYFLVFARNVTDINTYSRSERRLDKLSWERDIDSTSYTA